MLRRKGGGEAISDVAGADVDVVLVGHCGPDSFGLKRAVKKHLPGANIKKVNSWNALQPYCRSGAVLLINRVLDGSFEADGGVELITRIARMDDPPAMMLISNYDDAQRKAEAVGAQPGFGKAQLRERLAGQRLRAAAEMTK